MHVLLDAAYDQLPTNEVRAFMDTCAQTINPDTDLLSIAQAFLLTSYRRLPVLDTDGYLVGQVSRRDVIRAAMKEIDFRPVKENSFLYISALMDSHDAPIT
jgi:CBS-domain-containing membrane protein